MEIDWIIKARVFNPSQTIHAQLVQFFTKQQILDFTKQKELADDKFKFNEIGSKFLKWVENTVGKGEIAESRTISPFPTVFSVFKRFVLQTRKKTRACLGKG